MADEPIREFGKRKAALPEPSGPPPKRSSHVALLLMGTFAVGGGAYALMPRGTCEPNQLGMATPAGPQPGAGCTSSRWSSGSHGYWGGSSRYSFFGGPSSGAPSEANTGVTRGGFGSFAQSIAAHFSRGG